MVDCFYLCGLGLWWLHVLGVVGGFTDVLGLVMFDRFVMLGVWCIVILGFYL